LDQIQARKRLDLPPICFCLGFVGNIYERYDFNSILKAIIVCQDEIPNLYFVIMGDGPLTYEIMVKVNELGLEKKTMFTGYVQLGELGSILPATDVGLLLLTKEDALRYGPVTTKFSTYAFYRLPVIAAGSSLEGYPEELAQGLSLVPPEDHRALANMILWLYHHPAEREEKAKILHDYAVKKLSWDVTTKDILDIINYDKKMQ
jgi:glycosyltransferase involved in cell wall biosynthesis